jgi:hypothetical protein
MTANISFTARQSPVSQLGCCRDSPHSSEAGPRGRRRPPHPACHGRRRRGLTKYGASGQTSLTTHQDCSSGQSLAARFPPQSRAGCAVAPALRKRGRQVMAQVGRTGNPNAGDSGGRQVRRSVGHCARPCAGYPAPSSRVKHPASRVERLRLRFPICYPLSTTCYLENRGRPPYCVVQSPHISKLTANSSLRSG